MSGALMNSLGMIVVPLVMVLIGFGYLFLAFCHDDYVNKKGQAYFCKLHPNEYPPADAGFWCLLAIEKERKERIKEKQTRNEAKKVGKSEKLGAIIQELNKRHEAFIKAVEEDKHERAKK
jgi:hypothetical protein